ncbi:hypothetical protein TNIN_352801 [Trichonephila inaurata madagascariensis]|uniref:Uncharacterized protein n=1 Tax=Trichonephila inaurata madagascariensis TaxID=2747483 RepID=A0A8X6YJ08_9ARAC|nr:hypothetical protein TNIN_352801 [Trichonephila inaurata madagascariensis]
MVATVNNNLFRKGLLRCSFDAAPGTGMFVKNDRYSSVVSPPLATFCFLFVLDDTSMQRCTELGMNTGCLSGARLITLMKRRNFRTTNSIPHKAVTLRCNRDVTLDSTDLSPVTRCSLIPPVTMATRNEGGDGEECWIARGSTNRIRSPSSLCPGPWVTNRCTSFIFRVCPAVVTIIVIPNR